ncbi:hypothetical protein [Aeoliella sp. SH292]|uniref:hypothetical protein n=1 Tax=Aeoliella sp. SH292 TaxID=3454464 RepID=UPI003F9DDA05
MRADHGGNDVGDPDPETIRQRCAEIQATWTPRERAKRQVVGAVGWELQEWSGRVQVEGDAV